MVFNWFKRQFSTDSSSDVAEQENSPVEAGVADQASNLGADSTDDETLTLDETEDNSEDIGGSPPTDEVEDEEDSAEDYLAWAQAAFDNLQGSSGDEPVEDTEISEGEAIAPEPEPEVPQPITSQTAPSVSPSVADTSAEINQQSETEQSNAEQSDTEQPDTEQPDKAAENNQTSEPTSVEIEVPSVEAADEPQIEPKPNSKTSEPILKNAIAQKFASSKDTSEIDEGFIWSAEILAAQGRQAEDVSLDEINWLQKLRKGLTKTRRGLVNQLKSVVGKGPLNQDAVEEIETLLLQADVGVEATDIIVESLQNKIRTETLPADQAIAYLKELLQNMLDRPYENGYAASFAPEKNQLNVWLMAGVNGVGKTTTIGKITNVAKTSGYACLIAAADTFRAAAVEQVKVWGERSQVEVICNPGKNTDPAAVVFDAIAAAQSRGTELLLVDTAGRLQNKKNLMDELAKVRRIIHKKAPDARVESLLVLDATLGQNGLRQAQVFAEAAQLTGVILTKLDGTAKGGIALGVVQQMGLPIRFIGAGEGISDLRPFSSYEFVEALLSA